MKKFRICMVVVCVLILVCTAVFAADPKLPELRRDVNDKVIPPIAVYNATSGAYELIYFSADANGYINITVASGTVSIPTPVPVTGTFWQATQPISASSPTTGVTAYINGTVPVSGTFFPATQAVSMSSPTAGVTAYIDGTVPVSGTFWQATQPIQDSAYVSKVSSGTSDKIIGTDTNTITVTDNVTDYSFKYTNTSDIDNYASIKLSHTGDFIYLKNGESYTKSKLAVPVAITFTMTNLQVGSTTQFKIDTVK